MDLVNEQQCALARDAPSLGPVERLAQVLDAGKDRRQLLEFQVGLVGEQAGDGRLTGAGRAPQDHRGNAAGTQQTGQRAVIANQVILANNVVKDGGTQPVGQRPRCIPVHSGSLEEIVVAAHRKHPPSAMAVQR